MTQQTDLSTQRYKTGYMIPTNACVTRRKIIITFNEKGAVVHGNFTVYCTPLHWLRNLILVKYHFHSSFCSSFLVWVIKLWGYWWNVFIIKVTNEDGLKSNLKTFKFISKFHYDHLSHLIEEHMPICNGEWSMIVTPLNSQ